MSGMTGLTSEAILFGSMKTPAWRSSVKNVRRSNASWQGYPGFLTTVKETWEVQSPHRNRAETKYKQEQEKNWYLQDVSIIAIEVTSISGGSRPPCNRNKSREDKKNKGRLGSGLRADNIIPIFDGKPHFDRWWYLRPLFCTRPDISRRRRSWNGGPDPVRWRRV